jgi:hypothetical protein
VDIDIRVHDLTAQISALEKGQLPEIILRRESSAESVSEGTWWMINSLVSTKLEDIAWSQNRKSPTVRIPMLPYQLKEQSAEILVQFGLQTSALLVAIGRLKLNKEPRKMYVAMSNVFARGDEIPGYTIYLGAAFLEQQS